MRYNYHTVENDEKVLENFMQNTVLLSSTNINEVSHVIKSADSIITAFRNNRIGHTGAVTLAFKVKAQLFDNFIDIGSIESVKNSSYIAHKTSNNIDNDAEIVKSFFRAKDSYFSNYEFIGITNDEQLKLLLKSADNIVRAFRTGTLHHNDTITLAFKARAYIFDTYMYRKVPVKNNIRGKSRQEYIPVQYTIPEGTVTEHAKRIFEENHNVCQTHTTTYYHYIDKVIPPLSDILITNPTIYHDSYSDIKKIENMLSDTYSEYAKENITKKITLMIYNEFNINNTQRHYDEIKNNITLKSYQRKNILYRLDAKKRKKIVKMIVTTPPLTMAADAAYGGYTGASYGEEHAFYPKGRKVPKCKSLDEYDLDGRNTRSNGIRFIEDGRQY